METIRLINQRYPINITVLDSGLTVMTAETGSDFLNAGVVLSVGTFQDGDVPGVAHYLEHVIANGRGKQDLVHPRFLSLFPKGASKDGATTFGYFTKYEASGYSNQMSELISALVGMVFKPTINQWLVDQERQAILQEMRENEVSTFLMNWDREQAFPDAPHVHQSGAGTFECVSEMGPDDLLLFWQKYYGAENAAIVLAGGITHDEVLEVISKQDIKIRSVDRLRNKQLEISLSRKQLSVPLDINKTKLLFRSPLEDVLAEFLIRIGINCLVDLDIGSMMQRMRRQQGLVYGIKTSVNSYPYEGIIFSFPTQEEHFDLIEEIFFDEIDQVFKHGFSPFVWECISSSMVLACRRLFHSIGDQEAFEELVTRFNRQDFSDTSLVSQISSITQEQVIAELKKYITPDHYGRHDYTPDWED